MTLKPNIPAANKSIAAIQADSYMLSIISLAIFSYWLD